MHQAPKGSEGVFQGILDPLARQASPSQQASSLAVSLAESPVNRIARQNPMVIYWDVSWDFIS